MQGLEDKRSLTQRTSEVWWGIGAESGKFGICCTSTLLPSAQSMRVYQITLTLLLALTYLLSSGKSSDWKAEPSFNLRQLKRIYLPGVHRESRQTDRQRVLKKHSTGSLDWCVNLWERKEAVLTCWVTPRLRSVVFVFLIYRWFSEHKRAPEMLKNANGTPPHTHTLPPPPPFPNFGVENRQGDEEEEDGVPRNMRALEEGSD